MANLTGRQRLRQIRVKSDIIRRRQIADFMAGRLDVLPCSGDRETAFICAEFERVYALGFAAGRAALSQEAGDD